MPDEIAIRLTFTYDDPTYGQLCDAIYFTEEEWAKISKEDIAARKQERIDGFIESKRNPPQPDPKAELQRQIDAVDAQIAPLDAQKLDLADQLAAIKAGG